ncbi:MAG: hypothetical protein ABJN69_07635 [Hellea sp.]
MTALAEIAIDLRDNSPAEAIMNLVANEALRFSFCKTLTAGQGQLVELYVWICPKTHFYRGINIVNKIQVHAISETPLSSKDVLSKINATCFRPGTDPIEKLPEMNVGDLQRLYHLNREAA